MKVELGQRWAWASAEYVVRIITQLPLTLFLLHDAFALSVVHIRVTVARGHRDITAIISFLQKRNLHKKHCTLPPNTHTTQKPNPDFTFALAMTKESKRSLSDSTPFWPPMMLTLVLLHPRKKPTLYVLSSTQTRFPTVSHHFAFPPEVKSTHTQHP